MDATAPKIKFCGITDPRDAADAVAAGAWAIGLIFSYRRQVEIVGVFVSPTLEHVARTADAVGLTMVQLHGDEGPAFCAEVARRTGCKVIKAARVRSRADIQALAPFHTDYHLLDSHVLGTPGGTGETFAWDLARAHDRRLPLILSGGLNSENVADAIEAVRPFAVDVASGVEASPGRKDPHQLKAFAAAVASTAAVNA
jgi:phosphoribosylanthranilate isomerase